MSNDGCPAAADFVWPSGEMTECPFPRYEAMRRDAPIYKYPDRDDYLVFRYEDVVAIARQTDRFSNQLLSNADPRIVRTRTQAPGARSSVGKRQTPYASASSDPPEHQLKRALGAKMFTRRRMLGYESMIRGHADRLIDEWIDAGECDFRDGFSDMLPVHVISEILGMPEEDAHLLREWSDLEAGGASRYASEERRKLDTERSQSMADYLREQILARVAEPRDDFLSELIQSQVKLDGERDLDYLVSESALLLFAGNVTTAHLIANMMVELCNKPGIEHAIRADRSLIPQLVEEMLRLASPVQWTQRICTQETAVGGVTIPVGAWVILFWASANRDDERFPTPDGLDLHRPSVAKYELAFGYGIHRCIGAPLARQEGRIAIEALLDRLESFQIDEQRSDLANIDSNRFRVPRRLTIEFEPSAAVAVA